MPSLSRFSVLRTEPLRPALCPRHTEQVWGFANPMSVIVVTPACDGYHIRIRLDAGVNVVSAPVSNLVKE